MTQEEQYRQFIQGGGDPAVWQHIASFLQQKNSPYLAHIGDFVSAAQRIGVDPRFLVAITGAENGFGRNIRHAANVGSIFSGGHYQRYNSLTKGIDAMAHSISKMQIAHGLTDSLRQFAFDPHYGYAPLGAANDPNQTNIQWPGMVSSFMREMGASPDAAFNFPSARPAPDTSAQPTSNPLPAASLSPVDVSAPAIGVKAPIPDPTPTVWEGFTPGLFGTEGIPSPYLAHAPSETAHESNPMPASEKFSPIDYWSAMNPAPHEEAGPTAVDQWPAWNPVPQNEQVSPVDIWPGMNPVPQNEQFSPADQWSPMNPAPANEQFSPVNWFATNPEPSNETPTPVDTYSQQPISTAALDYEPLSPVDVYSDQISSPGEITDNPFMDESWLPATESPVTAAQTAKTAQTTSSQPAWVNAPHTGEVFQATIVDPNTGRISTFDPVTGGYVPIAGPAGWTNTGYGAGSPYGAGSAGYGGGGFGGYGGLGGTGAPVTGHVGGMVDTSTPEGLSHGGVDPTSGSSPGPGGPGSVVKGMTVGEAGIRSEDNPRGIAQWQAQQDYLDSLGGPVQRYISGYVHQKYFGLGGHMSQQKSGPDYGGGHGYMAPVYTTDPALALPTNVIPFPATLSPVDAAALLTGTHG